MAKLFNGKTTSPENAVVHLIGESLLVNGKAFSLPDITISFISDNELNLIIDGMNLELKSDDPGFHRILDVFREKKENTTRKGVTYALAGFLGLIVLFFVVSFVSERLPDKYFKLLVNEDFLFNLFPGTCTLDDKLNHDIMASIGEKNLRFYVINIPLVNALAYPFDQIFITHEMLQSLQSDHELFAVLGHEAGHLKLKHYKGQIGRMLFVDVISSVLDRGQVGKLAETILLNSYSREHEREADRYALDVLKKKGYPAKAGASLMNLLKEKVPEFGPSFLRSHPVTEERLAFFMKAAEKETKRPSQDRTLILEVMKACMNAK